MFSLEYSKPHHPLLDTQMGSAMFNITALLQTEHELAQASPGNERDAKVNLLKYCQVDTVKKYRRIADGLYFDLVQGGGLCHLRQIIEVEGDRVQPMQTGSIEDYLREAEKAKGCLDALVKEVAHSVGAEAFVTGVKTPDSTRRKVEIVGDIRKITDMARATVVCDTPEDLAKVYERLKQRLPKVRGICILFVVRSLMLGERTTACCASVGLYCTE